MSDSIDATWNEIYNFGVMIDECTQNNLNNNLCTTTCVKKTTCDCESIDECEEFELLPLSLSITPGSSISQSLILYTLPQNILSSYFLPLPFNNTTEGNGTVSINGLFQFYPAPRFLGNAIGNFQMTTMNGRNYFSPIKIMADLSYRTPNSILTANNTNMLSLWNIDNSTNVNYAMPIVITKLASNKSDMILYLSSPGTKIIVLYDWALQTTIGTLDVSPYIDTLPGIITPEITALGYDDLRNILYVGFNQANHFLKISFNPYTRYPSPIFPSFCTSVIHIPGGTILPSDIYVADIAIDKNTGNIYFTARGVIATDLYLYLITSNGTLLGATDGTFYLPSEIYQQVGYSSKNELCANDGLNVYYIGNSTLLSSPSRGPLSFQLTTTITEFSEPLFGM